MVGLQTLALPVGVRIPASQLFIPDKLALSSDIRGFPLWGDWWGPCVFWPVWLERSFNLKHPLS